jgi:hypothetical protein
LAASLIWCLPVIGGEKPDALFTWIIDVFLFDFNRLKKEQVYVIRYFSIKELDFLISGQM